MNLRPPAEGPSAAVVGSASPTRAGVQVQLVELRRRFGEVAALDGLSLDLAPGELVALLGPSGCGKTTALRSLAGLERLDSGRVLLDGRDITNTPASRRDMGMVFQAYSLFPHLTARENVAFGLRLRRMASAKRRKAADRLLELVHLARQGNRFPHELSGGQQQRVALARALAIEPQVLLLDEPLSALDAKVRSTLRDEIRRIQTEVGITTVFVTHDQDEALAIADRVAVIFAGRLEQIAPPAELYERPRTARVADFVGLSNHIRGVAQGRTATVLETELPLLEGSATGGQVTMLIRPEAIELDPDPTGPGRVAAVSFLGSIARARVDLSDGTSVLAQMSSAEVTRFRPGDAVRIWLKPRPAGGQGLSPRSTAAPRPRDLRPSPSHHDTAALIPREWRTSPGGTPGPWRNRRGAHVSWVRQDGDQLRRARGQPAQAGHDSTGRAPRRPAPHRSCL
jgi:putative spermidine/putrescine transport system ATP-binding protein